MREAGSVAFESSSGSCGDADDDVSVSTEVVDDCLCIESFEFDIWT